MKTQVTIMERRQHAREGMLAEIENITYRVLRQYGVNGPTGQNRLSNMAEEAA
jgi:hypothetical protein